MFLIHRHAPLLAGLGVAVVLASALLLVDAFSPPALPTGFSSMGQLVGMDLLLILVPAYLITSWGYAQRRSRELLARVDQMLPRPEFAARVQSPPTRLLIGAVVGVLYAVVFNLPIDSLGGLIEGGALLMVLVACMILVWMSVGLTLSARLHVSRLFLEAGRRVPVDLYDRAPLEPFARAGMGDLLLVVGALVLSTVQSIDATFRAENYLYALVVAVPAGLVLLIWPMASLHGRLKALKRAELAELDRLIGAASKALDPAAMERLERLLQRRQRANEVYTWPLNVAMVSRILLYGVIPPAAWVAAALVEQFIETAIGR